ncbi:hypothetical protein HY250_04715 [Candidatus Azambacteria bacterium]|nr:hypothetical protein [Candidatus Azambacteria bacterium]
MTTLSPEGKKNVIHCVDPFIRFADGACMVWYTEHYSTRFKKENHGKRMIVLLGEIIEARTWDHYQAHPSR